MSDEDPFSVDVKLQRGNGTDDRDTVKASVSAASLEQLDQRLDGLRDRLETEVEELRDIQPEDGRSVADDQATLASEEGSS